MSGMTPAYPSHPRYYMQALIYLKIATAAYYKARESLPAEMTINLKKAQKYLEISRTSIKTAKARTRHRPAKTHLPC